MIGNRRESEASVARTKVMKAPPSVTPLTAVTKASTSALGYTPNSVATFNDENKSVSSSRMSLKNTKDIVAQWKREREQGRNKLGDIMNTVPNQRSSKKPMQVSIQEEQLPSEKMKDQKEDELLDEILCQQNVLSPEVYDNSTQASSPNFTTEESIRTTPTGNTALNSYGIEKLCNRNVGSIGGKTLNVRLFPTGALKEEDTAQDVSMMTQDTDLQQMIPHKKNDVDQILDEIQKEKGRRNQDNDDDEEEPEPEVEDNYAKGHDSRSQMRQSSGTVSDALSSMQAALEKSRLIRERQEKLLAKQDEEIQRMKQEKAEWLKGQEAFQSALGNSVDIVLEQLYNIYDICGIQSGQDLATMKDQPIVSILHLMEDLSSTHIPELMAAVEDSEQRQVEANAKLVDTLAQTKEADADLASKKEKLSGLENKLKDADGQLDDMMKVLRNEQNEIDAKKLLLAELEKEVEQKQNELAEIDRLCDERVAVAHETEINAKEIADEVARQDQEVKEMFDALQRRQESIKITEKSLRLKMEEFESSQLASEARIHLKENDIDKESKRIEEQRSQLDELEALLNERQMQLEDELSNVEVVKRDLVDKEVKVDEREQELEEMKLELEKRANSLTLSDDELKRKQEELDQLTLQVRNQEEELSRREADLHMRSESLDQKISEFEEDREEFMKRVKALEDGESDLEKRSLNLVDQTNAHEEAIKAFQIQSENKERAISKLEAELDTKRHDVETQVTTLLEQKSKVEAALTKERGELKDLYQERKNLQHDISALESKYKSTSTSFEELNTEITKARYMAKKKLTAAKDELEMLRNAFDEKEAEIGTLSDQERKLQNEVDELLRAKDEIMQAIAVKEGLLKQVDANIKSCRDEWELQKSKELEDTKNEVEKTRQDAMIEILKQKDAARLEMIEMSKTFYSKHEDTLNQRAHQLELLHSQLQKLSEKVSLDREKLTMDRHALDSEIGDRTVLQETIDSLKCESEAYATKIQDLSEQLEKSKEKCCTLDSEIKKYTEQMEDLSEQLKMEKSTNTELQDNIVSLKGQIVQLQQKEYELQKDKEMTIVRVKALEEREKQLAEIEKRESTLRDDFEALVELQEIVNQEKIRIESESKKIKESTQALEAKESKVSSHEKKLKEYTLQLQKQSKEIKEKEKSLQQAVRLFSEKRNESANRDAAKISELKQALAEEQERYSSLYQKYQEIRSGDREIETQERIRQIALQLKAKDEELTLNQRKLDEKLAKCDECEMRLQHWQNELEALASTLRSEE